MNMFKVKLFFLFGSIITISILYLYPSNRSLQYYRVLSNYNETNEITKINETREIKTILFWTKFYCDDKDYFCKEIEPFKLCEIKECYATIDRNYVPIDEFDAIMFHVPSYQYQKDKAPQKRNVNQRYIFYTHESPASRPSDVNIPKQFYNWTLTYSRKSDVYVPYSLVIKENNNYTIPDLEYVRNKTKFAAWFVSNCCAKSKRDDYAKELQKYVDVDVYGKCGKQKCPRSNATECYQMLEDDYLFYLSFENTMCEDYITEKLYYVLEYNVIPVTYGYGNYTELSPPYSSINTADFKTVKDLANYLIYLKEHPEEYLKYFAWKKQYKIIAKEYYNLMCHLCKKLHTDTNIKIYDDAGTWWSKTCIDHSNIKIERIPLKVWNWTPTQRNKRGRPRMKWISNIQLKMESRGLHEGETGTTGKDGNWDAKSDKTKVAKTRHTYIQI